MTRRAVQLQPGPGTLILLMRNPQPRSAAALKIPARDQGEAACLRRAFGCGLCPERCRR
jgi:hypothetical protein